ncbi:MscS family membrane protein [Albimonas donghaensis]|uniref:MscS family membrane protein n=1 Tax=Albimonas donghaensis TaxID=356660 RepID=A0A1H2T8S5_9RHOB|nr:mechanosensitive ion channel domain-containing protein [Albimonas donghaensis]SDW40343.1 MscS family membrane protein [Albimonas donghaensis]
MLRAFLSLAFLVCASAVAAQDRAANPLTPLELSSPRATYGSVLEASREIEAAFLAYTRERTGENARAISAAVARSARVFDLSQTPQAQRGEAAVDAITHLFDILMRLPPLDPASIRGDDAADLPARWAIPGTEIVMAPVASGPRSGDWLFTPRTVSQLEAFHARIRSAPLVQQTLHADWSRELMAWTGPAIPAGLSAAMPEFLAAPVLGTQAWKVVLTVLIWAGSGALVVGWGLLMGRTGLRRQSSAGLALRMTTPALLALLAWQAHVFAVHQSNLTGAFAQGEVVATTLALHLAFAWLMLLACHLFVELIVALPAIPDQSYDAHLLRLLARVGGLMAAGAVLLFGADRIGIPALGVLAGVGVGGVALALAAQSTVENLFGGVSIFVDRPFRIGDFIQYGAATGTVEAIGPRSSRLRGLDGTLTTVPNGDLAKMHIVNYSVRNKCLFLQVLGLRYETSRLQIEWILEAMRRRLASHPMVEEGGGMPRVRLVGFGASAIDIEVRAQVLTRDFAEFLEIQETLLLELQETIEEAGSGFAFPSQTVYLGRDSGLDAEARERAEQSALAARGKRELGDAMGAR